LAANSLGLRVSETGGVTRADAAMPGCVGAIKSLDRSEREGAGLDYNFQVLLAWHLGGYGRD
jgi:hypothetical protein